MPRALWVWSKNSWYSPESRTTLLRFARDHRITEFFLQVGYTGRTMDHPDVYRDLLRECTANGILVHALDGDPEAVLSKNHESVLNLARAVIAFNAESKPGERFYGLHLDNEPYVLPAYGGRRRGKILSQYLELNTKIAALTKGSGVAFGVDIPFWFDGLQVKYKGKTKSVMEHVVDCVDNVGIMDYRNKAAGGDGLIALAETEIEYAGRLGKRVYVGVETIPPGTSSKILLWGFPTDEWDANEERFPFLFSCRYRGFRISTLEGAGRSFLGLSVPDEGERAEGFETALRELQRLAPPVDERSVRILLREAEDLIKGDREYDGIEAFRFPGEKLPAGFRTKGRGLPKITFSGKSPEDMERELAAVVAAFKGRPGFYGFAIHHYRSYREFLKK